MSSMLHWGLNSQQRRAAAQRGRDHASARINEAMTQPSKAELREMLTRAVKNTAKLEQKGESHEADH